MSVGGGWLVFTMRAGTPTATQHGGRLVITTLPAPTCPAAAAAEVTVVCLRLLFTHSSCTMQFLPHVYLNIPPKPWSCSQFYSGWRSACRRLRGAVGIQLSTPDEPQLTSRWQRSHSSPQPGAFLTTTWSRRCTLNHCAGESRNIQPLSETRPVCQGEPRGSKRETGAAHPAGHDSDIDVFGTTVTETDAVEPQAVHTSSFFEGERAHLGGGADGDGSQHTHCRPQQHSIPCHHTAPSCPRSKARDVSWNPRHCSSGASHPSALLWKPEPGASTDPAAEADISSSSATHRCRRLARVGSVRLHSSWQRPQPSSSPSPAGAGRAGASRKNLSRQ